MHLYGYKQFISKNEKWKNSKYTKIEQCLNILWSIYMTKYLIYSKTHASNKYLLAQRRYHHTVK